jgi:hypothetical protein
MANRCFHCDKKEEPGNSGEFVEVSDNKGYGIWTIEYICNECIEMHEK